MSLWVALGLGIVTSMCSAACQRAVAASFVPTLQVQVSAHQTKQGLVRSRRWPWDANVIAWLRFTPRIAASDMPMRAEFDAEVAAMPCEPEDAACLEEFVEGEQAALRLLGELE